MLLFSKRMLSDSFFCVEYYLFSFLWIWVCPRNVNLFLCWKTEQLQLKKIFINERKKEIEQRRRSANWEKIKWAKKKINKKITLKKSKVFNNCCARRIEYRWIKNNNSEISINTNEYALIYAHTHTPRVWAKKNIII